MDEVLVVHGRKELEAIWNRESACDSCCPKLEFDLTVVQSMSSIVL
jgi:hypothetical protein